MEVVYVARRRRGRKTYGKKFRTRAGRYGRYVYRNGRKVGFEAVKFGYRSAKSGARRYVAERTYRTMRKRWRY